MMHMGGLGFEADDPTKKALGYPGPAPQQPQALPPPQQPPPMLITSSSPLTVRLSDLVPRDGLPHDTYRVALGSLMTSIARFNTAIIQLPPGDEALLRYTMDSAKVYFQYKRRPSPSMQSIPSMDDPQEWNRTAGYYCEPQVGKESYEYRPGRSAGGNSMAGPSGGPGLEDDLLPPSCLPETFGALGRASRVLLEAIGRSLDLRSYTFAELLDNTPLKAPEVSHSVLSTLCHGRRHANESLMEPGAGGLEDKEALLMAPEDAEPKVEKGLLALLRTDRPGLYVRDPQNQWLLADANLGPSDLILITGLTLYQATGGYVSPTMYKSHPGASQGHHGGGHPLLSDGHLSLLFRLMPRSSSIIHCSSMVAAGHAISTPFQQPVAVQDFMLRQHPVDQIISSSYGGLLRPIGMPVGLQETSSRKRKKMRANGEMGGSGGPRSLAPSKRLRMEAQRVLKEKVQDLADAKGIKIRFCNLKECEEQHLNMEEPPCGYLRVQLGWPAGVPFVHPHDLPNRAKQSFLEAYEPGWSERQSQEPQGIEVGTTPKRSQDQQLDMSSTEAKFSTRAVYEFLRNTNKPVPTGKPQVVGHKVDIPLLCRSAYEAGGREQFEVTGGFQRFIADTFHLENATEKERERALERLKKLYEQVLADYVEHLMGTQAMGTPTMGTPTMGAQGMNSQGMGSQGMGSQGMGSQGMGSQGMGSQGMGSQGMSTQGMGSQSMGAQGMPQNLPQLPPPPPQQLE